MRQSIPTTEDVESGIRNPEDSTQYFINDQETTENIKKVIESYTVVIFSLSACPFCLELKRTLG